MFEPEVGVLYAAKLRGRVTYYLGVECRDTGETKLLMSSAELNSIVADPFCYMRFNSNAWETEVEDNCMREAGFVIPVRYQTLDDVDDEAVARWDLSGRSYVMGSHTFGDEFQRLLIVALPKEFDEYYSLTSS